MMNYWGIIPEKKLYAVEFLRGRGSMGNFISNARDRIILYKLSTMNIH